MLLSSINNGRSEAASAHRLESHCLNVIGDIWPFPISVVSAQWNPLRIVVLGVMSAGHIFNILYLGIYDIDKSRFQASSADKESINITLFGKVTTVLLANATSVNDPSRFGGFWRD